MNIFKPISLGLLSLSLHFPVAMAESSDIQDEAGYATSTLDARVARLEKKAANQPLTEVVREMDRLREELKKLRGQVEEMHNALERQSGQTAALLQRSVELEARLQGGQLGLQQSHPHLWRPQQQRELLLRRPRQTRLISLSQPETSIRLWPLLSRRLRHRTPLQGKRNMSTPLKY